MAFLEPNRELSLQNKLPAPNLGSQVYADGSSPQDLLEPRAFPGHPVDCCSPGAGRQRMRPRSTDAVLGGQGGPRSLAGLSSRNLPPRFPWGGAQKALLRFWQGGATVRLCRPLFPVPRGMLVQRMLLRHCPSPAEGTLHSPASPQTSCSTWRKRNPPEVCSSEMKALEREISLETRHAPAGPRVPARRVSGHPWSTDWSPRGVLAAPLSLQLPSNASGEAAADAPSTWEPMWETRMERQVPGFGSALPQPFCPVGE